MSIVADQPLRAGLAEEVERQESEDNALGPEPEARFVLSQTGWWRRVLPVLPTLPTGYVAADPRAELGGDELRARYLRAEAIARFGSAR
ncbi:hypothetical protein ACF1BP_37110 [Streptomyces sp. NPDC014735]|uniref:hypothetical protein n=1 Tax=Bacteria TaxID=2 RepID=UPI0036FD438C